MTNIFQVSIYDKAKQTFTHNVQELSSFSFFTRNTLKECFMFSMRTVCERAEVGKCSYTPPVKKDLQLKGYVLHISVVNQTCYAMITSDSYPRRVAFEFLNRCSSEFDLERLSEHVKAFQNPKTDKLVRLQQELDDVKEIMMKNVEEVLKRGENLDVLAQKAEDLSNNSKVFFKETEKLNKCCKLL